MAIISAKKFLLWEKKQLLKGGDKKSLSLLIDLLGGLSKKELNFLMVQNSLLKMQFSRMNIVTIKIQDVHKPITTAISSP